MGHDPARLEELRFLGANPTASLYDNRTQLRAAIESACLDILGQRWEVPVSALPGGRLRDRVRFASYLFFRYPSPRDGSGEVRTIVQMVAEARMLKAEHGFTSHELKGGVFAPEHELECYRAETQALAGDRFAANVLDTAVDVILLDTTFWGKIRPCVKAAGVCETFQLGVAVHSSGELGTQLATTR